MTVRLMVSAALILVGFGGFAQKEHFKATPSVHTAEISRTSFFQELEQRWAEAIKRKDTKALESDFLADDYALRIADDPSRQITRAAWLSTLAFYNTRTFAISNLEVRDFGDSAVVSLSLRQDADVNGVDRSGQFFIVDVWTLREGKWKVSARYSSPGRQLPNMP